MKILFAACLALSVSQVAVALTVDEGSYLDDAAFESQTFVLDPGRNTVTGHQFNTTSGLDWDSFRFRVLPGLEVTGITVTYSNVQLLGGTTVLRDGTGLNKCLSAQGACSRLVNSYQLAASDPSQSILWANLANPAVQNTQTVIFPGQMPLTLGYYQITDLALSKNGLGGSWDYTYAFDVASSTVIPLPPAGLLLGTALVGVALRRRRSKAAV